MLIQSVLYSADADAAVVAHQLRTVKPMAAHLLRQTASTSNWKLLELAAHLTALLKLYLKAPDVAVDVAVDADAALELPDVALPLASRARLCCSSPTCPSRLISELLSYIDVKFADLLYQRWLEGYL